ncbi:MAG: GSCFA domain-containing protein, partial [Firmicutes bacterium]|nr:GSCFA domain-containing protein [Bacillota bacterium]
DNLNNALLRSREFLVHARVAIITLGTAWTYTLKASGETVGNCHKLPAAMFERKMITVETAVTEIKKIVRSLQSLNPAVKVVFTISPIRHTADGLHCNQLSKATLLIAVNRVCEEINETCSYFPAYEILLDDLRDYRFYAADMKHPSEVAVNYIYNIFSESYFSKQTQETAREARKLSARLEHRNLSDNNEAMKSFIADTIDTAHSLSRKYPELTETIQSLITHKFHQS